MVIILKENTVGKLIEALENFPKDHYLLIDKFRILIDEEDETSFTVSHVRGYHEIREEG